MHEEPIPRATEPMSRELFTQLFDLTKKQPWLIRKSGELYDTVSICDNNTQKALLIDLISRIHFRSHRDHADDLENIAQKICKGWNCGPDNTLICALQDDSCADSSSMIVQQLKLPLTQYGNWRTSNFITGLREAVSRTKKSTNIVIVDDFCGTGDSIYKKIRWINDKLTTAGKTANIFVAICSSMKQSKAVIEPLVEEFYSVHWLGRGIRDHYQDSEQNDAVNQMIEIEKKLAKRSGNKNIDDFRFGWKQSEALFFLESGNPPNNNFPILWWRHLDPNIEWKSLLPRI